MNASNWRGTFVLLVGALAGLASPQIGSAQIVIPTSAGPPPPSSDVTGTYIANVTSKTTTSLSSTLSGGKINAPSVFVSGGFSPSTLIETTSKSEGGSTSLTLTNTSKLNTLTLTSSSVIIKGVPATIVYNLSSPTLLAQGTEINANATLVSNSDPGINAPVAPVLVLTFSSPPGVNLDPNWPTDSNGNFLPVTVNFSLVPEPSDFVHLTWVAILTPLWIYYRRRAARRSMEQLATLGV